MCNRSTNITITRVRQTWKLRLIDALHFSEQPQILFSNCAKPYCMLRWKLNVARNPAAVHKSKLHERKLKYNARRADFSVAVFSPRQTQAAGWQAVNSISILAPDNTLQNVQFFLEAQSQQQQQTNRMSRGLFRTAHCFCTNRISITDTLARGILKTKLVPHYVCSITTRIRSHSNCRLHSCSMPLHELHKLISNAN